MKLHLGCGARIEPGWINIDLEIDDRVMRTVAEDMQIRALDVRRGLPFGAGSVDLIYSEHFVEHLTAVEGAALFRECARVLKVGGVMRISTPDLAAVVEAYVQNKLDVWHPVGYAPATRCQMVNESLTLWGHRFTYDADELAAALHGAGLGLVQRQRHGESLVGGMLTEGRPSCRDLIMETTK